LAGRIWKKRMAGIKWGGKLFLTHLLSRKKLKFLEKFLMAEE